MRRALRRMSSSGAPPSVVSYVTDVEGNLDYFSRYVARSAALAWAAGARVAEPDALELREGAEFVYGGDVFDRGARGCATG